MDVDEWAKEQFRWVWLQTVRAIQRGTVAANSDEAATALRQEFFQVDHEDDELD